MDPRTVELINLELDGRLDAAGRAELEARLADPAVRAHREQLQAVARALAQLPAEAPPEGFARELLARAAPPRRASPRRYWRAGLALAASVVAVALLLRVTGPEPGDAQAPMVGTLAPAVPTVRQQAVADGVRLRFEVPAGPAGEIVIEFTQGQRRIVVPPADQRQVLDLVVSEGQARDFRATLVREGKSTNFFEGGR